MPSGPPPTSMRAVTVRAAASMMETTRSSGLVTKARRPSGVTAMPAGLPWIGMVATTFDVSRSTILSVSAGCEVTKASSAKAGEAREERSEMARSAAPIGEAVREWPQGHIRDRMRSRTVADPGSAPAAGMPAAGRAGEGSSPELDAHRSASAFHLLLQPFEAGRVHAGHRLDRRLVARVPAAGRCSDSRDRRRRATPPWSACRRRAGRR